MMVKRVATVFLTLGILDCGAARAVEPFGFRFSMSRAEVEQAAARLGKVSGGGMSTVFVEDSDIRNHSYMFNFCGGGLHQATEILPLDMQGVFNLVDESIRLYGQPKSVSAERLEPVSGKLYAIKWIWTVDDTTSLHLEVLEEFYRINYFRECLQEEEPAADGRANAVQPAAQVTPEGLEQFVQTYYLNPRPDLVPGAMRALSEAPFANQPGSWQPYAAWFAAVFAANPERDKEWRRLVDRERKGWAKEVLDASLRIIDSGGVAAMAAQSTPGPPINDMYWGAFFASGNPAWIRSLVAQLRHIDDRQDSNAFANGATAKWSLSSNARRHPSVREIVLACREETDPRTAAIIDDLLAKEDFVIQQEVADIAAEQKAAGIWP